MIRMGKSSKTDDAAEKDFEEKPTDAEFSSSRIKSSPISESEMMAQDIKEGRLSGFVGNGTVLTGETTFDAMLRVDGHLKGSVTSDGGTLIVGANGRVDADIIVYEAVINGIVEGDITAGSKLTLGRSASVVGNVQAPRLIIDDGAILEGQCSMLASKDAVNSSTEASQLNTSTNEIAVTSDDEEEEEIISNDDSVVEEEDDDEDLNAAYV